MSTVEANHLNVSPKIGRNRVPQRLWKLKICKTVVSHTCVGYEARRMYNAHR